MESEWNHIRVWIMDVYSIGFEKFWFFLMHARCLIEVPNGEWFISSLLSCNRLHFACAYVFGL